MIRMEEMKSISKKKNMKAYGQAVDLKVQESIRLLVFQKFKKAYL